MNRSFFSSIRRLIKTELMKALWSHAIRRVLIASAVIIALWGVFFWYCNYVYAEPEENIEVDFSYEETEEFKESKREEFRTEIRENEAHSAILGEDNVRYRNAVLQYRLDNDILSIHNEPNTFHYVIFCFQTIGAVFVIIATIIFGNMFHDEYKNGTEKLLYTKPYTRTMIVLSKYFCAIIITLAVTAFLYVFLLLTGGFITSFRGGLGRTIYTLGTTVHYQSYVLYSFVFTGVFFLSMLVAGTMSFIVTGLTRSRLAGIGTGAALNIVGFTAMIKLYEMENEFTSNLFISYCDLLVFFDRPLPEAFAPWKAAVLLSTVLIILMIPLCYVISKRDV